jgi:hypothetical protein
MDEPRTNRSMDRRPILRLEFQPRVERSDRLWRRVFLYYMRHAERVWWRTELREAVRKELDSAKGVVIAAATAFDSTVLAAYEASPVIARREVSARFPETVEYVELFALADRAFAALRHPAAQATLGFREVHALRLEVTQALRRPAQVIADTPGLRRLEPAVVTPSQDLRTMARTDAG